MVLNKKASIQTQRLTLHVISEKDTEQLVQLLTNKKITKTFMVPDLKRLYYRGSSYDDKRTVKNGVS